MGGSAGSLDYYLQKFGAGSPAGLGRQTSFNFGGVKAPPLARPTVNIGASPIASRSTVERPNIGEFGTPSREGVDATYGQVSDFYKGFKDPTHTAAFQNVMALAGERTAREAGEARRTSMEAASRRGYVGGADIEGRGAERERMLALAETGFSGAKEVMGQYADAYKAALPGYTELVGKYNQQLQDRNIAFASAQNQARQLQAQLDEAYNKDLISVGEYQQHSRDLQAQLDIEFQKNQLEAAKLNQMFKSVDFTAQQHAQELAERAREFDATSAQHQREFESTSKQQQQQFDVTHFDQVKRFGAGAGTDAWGGRLPGYT